MATDPFQEQIARRRAAMQEAGVEAPPPADPMARVSDAAPADQPTSDDDTFAAAEAHRAAAAAEREAEQQALTEQRETEGLTDDLEPPEPEPETEPPLAAADDQPTKMFAAGAELIIDLDADKDIADQLAEQGFGEKVGKLIDDRPYRIDMGASVEGLEVVAVELALTGTEALHTKLAQIVSQKPFGSTVGVHLTATIVKREDKPHKDLEDRIVRKVTATIDHIEDVID